MADRRHVAIGRRGQRIGADVVDLVVVAVVLDMAEIDLGRQRLVGDQRGQPVFVGDARPAAGGGGVVGQAAMLVALGLGLVVGGLLQRAVDHAQQALEQHVVAGDLGLVVAADARPGEQRDRLAGGVLHRLVDREHVVVVDRQADLEGQPGAVVPGQRDRLAGRQLVRRRGPGGVVVRQFHGRACRRRPAILDVVGMILRPRLQQPDQRRVRGDLLAVVLQHQVIELGAQQIDRAFDARGVDLHAWDVRAVRLAGAGGTAAPGAPSSGVVTGWSGRRHWAICCGGGFGRCGATSIWKPSRIASDTAIARKSRFWSINAPYSGRPHSHQAGHGIDTTFMPRIAAQDTLRRHRRSSRRAVHPQRLHGVFAAAWPEAAMRADERTHRPLIDADRRRCPTWIAPTAESVELTPCHTPGSFQCAPDITLQSDEIPFARAVPADQHQIDPGHRPLLPAAAGPLPSAAGACGCEPPRCRLSWSR